MPSDTTDANLGRPLTPFERRLVAWVALAIRDERRVLWACGLLTLLLGAFTALNLGLDTDSSRNMLNQQLPSEQRMRAFEARFPLLIDSLLIVMDGQSGEGVRSAAKQLADALAERPDLARSMFVPDADPFFERHALLYSSVEELESFSDQMVRFQPVLGELSRSPDLATLTDLIRRALGEATSTPPEELVPLLDSFGDATESVYTEYPLRVSWQDLLLSDSSFRSNSISTLIVEPVQHFEDFLPAGHAISGIRGVGAELGIEEAGRVRMRITGYPALNDEEMRGLIVDVGIAGLFSFLMVLAVLAWSFRSAPMVAAAAITLIVGLIWTAAVAAAIVGRVNVVSIAFAVLFIGLGVDFAIHLGLHVLDELRAGRDHATAFAAATADVGPALSLCAASTAVGFFAFVPTDYRGVAELGLISGSGMFVILALTLTLFPALLTRLLPIGTPGEPVRSAGLGGRVSPGLVVAAAVLLGVVAVPFALQARLESNVVKMRDQDTESVKAWNDLLATGTGSPWYADLMTDDLDEAEAMGAQLSQLPEVLETRTLRTYVPDEQEDKLAILDDLAFFMDVPPPGKEVRTPPTIEEQVNALRALHTSLADGDVNHTGALGTSAALLRQRLRVFLGRIDGDEDPAAALATLEQSLLGRFPEQMDRLRAALEPEEIDLEALPARLTHRMLTDDGIARLQIFPTGDLTDDREMVGFVAAVQDVAPEVTGLPVSLVEFSRATARSLRTALLIATTAIVGMLLVLWWRPFDAVLAMAPLGLAGIWTIGTMGIFDIPFNFVNVVVLPLLLGMGVDSGVHMVRRARTGAVDEDLASTTTGRAVFLSSFTTLVSFGSLITAGHAGISSMGLVLVIGMAFTLVANLWVLPAWFLWRARGVAAARAEASAVAEP